MPRNYGFPGRERQWDVQIDNQCFRVARDEKGMPQWKVEAVPIESGDTEVTEERRLYGSLHLGCGYSERVFDFTYEHADGVDARFENVILLGPKTNVIVANGSAPCSGFFEQSGRMYAVLGRYIKQVDLVNDGVLDPDSGTQGIDFGEGEAVSSVTNFDGNSVVFLGENTDAYVFTGAAWSQATANHITGSYSTRVWIETDSGAAFYALVKSNASVDGPSVSWMPEGNAVDSDAWGAPYVVGDNDTTYRPITALTARDRTIWIARTDGLFFMDATGRAPQLVTVRSVTAENGRKTEIDEQGLVWMPTREGYYCYSTLDGSVRDMSPGRASPNEGPIRGLITAHTSYRGWRYAALYNGTDTYIGVGRPKREGEKIAGDFVWHFGLAKLANAQCHAMHITSLTSPPRLYYGLGTDTSFGIGYFKLPSMGDSPLLDSTYESVATGSITLGRDDWGKPGNRFQFLGCEMDVRGANVSNYVEVYVRLDGDAWTLLGRVDASGLHSLAAPSGRSWLCNTAQLRLNLTGVALGDLAVRSVVQRAARRYAVRDSIRTVLVCSDAAISRFNIPSRVSAAAQIEHIKNLQIGYPVSVVDYWTGSKRVRSMLVMPVKEQLVTQEGFDSPITAMEVMLLDLTAQQYEIPDYGSIGRLSGYSITDLIGTTVGGLADL